MKPDVTNPENETLIQSSNLFPVVGIGASAGGLEAFSKLLKAIPENSGMAYVLVQHLDPSHESLLPELLQRVTAIPVLEISDDIKVKPDHIYIIPSNKMLLATDGVLKLSPRPGKDKYQRNLPIDLFFTSLAEIHREHAIGVVLSGTASDGTLGLKSIKDQGGITFAQDEASAAFDGMPGSAAQAGVVDFILPPEQIPAKLLELKNQIILSDEYLKNFPEKDEEIFRHILALLRVRKGTDFTYYKQTTIRRRVLRRMVINKNMSHAEYLKFLQGNITEQDALYQDLLIPVTSFFRDPQVFDTLGETIFPNLIKNKKNGDPIRIWVAGCSTGEEAYSMAVCLKEILGDNAEKVQIFATDLSEPAITKARNGIYKKGEMEGISPQRLQNFFTKSNGDYRVNKDLRDSCVFARHNFLKDPPFRRIDFVSCRNVLIYLEPYLQKKALTTFHYSLNPKGVLLLGKSETGVAVPDLFSSLDKTDKLFIRKDTPSRFMHVASERSEQSLQDYSVNKNKEKMQTDFQKTADDIMLSKYTPAGVVVDDAMNIVHFRGATGMYLEQAPGQPTHNLIKMAKLGLGFELRNLLHKVKKEKAGVVKADIPWQVNGVEQKLSIEGIPLPNVVEPHYLILFHNNDSGSKPLDTPLSPNTKKDARDERIQQLEEELLQTHLDMRSITEDQETANEELQSANEELLSGSEELQSLNEELETSKEELQSTNEELTVLNQELLNLNAQVTESQRFAENIVATIREPLLVLDSHLQIKSANESFYKIFHAEKREIEKGILIYDLFDKQWDIPELRTLLEKILPEKKNFSDFELKHKFPFIGERILMLNAREMTGISSEEKLILLSLDDVTEKTRNEAKEKELSGRFQNLVMNAPVAICIFRSPKYHVELANEKMLELWGRKAEDVINKPMFEAMPDMSNQGFEDLLHAVYNTGTRYVTSETPMKVLRNGKSENIFIKLVYEALREPDGNVSGIIAVADEVTDLVLARKRKEAQEMMVQNLLLTAPAFICTLTGPNHVYELVNERYQQMIGKRKIQGKPILDALPELVGQGIDTILDNVYKTGKPYVGIEVPIRLARDEGKEPEERYLNFSYQPMYDENKNIFSILVFGYEVTEEVNAKNRNLLSEKLRSAELEERVKQRTLELQESNEELQEKNQEVALSQYNKRFLTEFSENFAGYKLHTEFFNSVVHYIADLTRLDYVLIGKLEETAAHEFFIQTIALTEFGKLTENIKYPLADSPCEQVIQGKFYAFPENCKLKFPKNEALAQLNADGFIGYPLYDSMGNAMGLIAVMHQAKIVDVETVSSILKIVAKRVEMELERIKYEDDLKKNNEELAEKNEELVKMNKELESFTYISSHDLQEPLRKIQTFSGILKETEYGTLTEKGKDYFNRMNRAAGRMQTLLEDLLIYSHTNVQERKNEKSDLIKVMEEVKEELSEPIAEKKAVIKMDSLCEADISPFQFRQVLINLTGNALKFSKKGVPPQITIKCDSVDGQQILKDNPALQKSMISPKKRYNHISFKDNGIGFSPEYKDKIFEVFQRLHGKEEYEGTGIGLAIVKKIVENHNGFITAEGEAEKGATFNIYLPVHE